MNRQLLKLMDRASELHASKQYAEAERLYLHALDEQPGNVEVNRLLGVCKGQQGKHEDAIGYLRLALAGAPHYAQAWANLGAALAPLGRYQESIDACCRALELDPSLDNARYTRGMVRLALGDWEKGFADYEKGLLSGDRGPRYVEKGRWHGGPLPSNKTLAIWWEQGYGDTIQFSQFVKQAHEWAGNCTVVFEVQPALRDLLLDTEGADAVVASEIGMVPVHDYHIPLMSLPYTLGLRPESCPGAPYLKARSKHRWRKTVKRWGGLPVGFCWKGNPDNPNDLNRSTDIADWQGVLETKPCVFHSLQVGESQHDFKTFDELAGLIANMELVITVDTAVAHLAGALGVPCWTLICKSPDWRWMLEGERTPFYNNMRLYRQETAGDWPSVLERVRADLESLTRREVHAG